MRVDGGDRTHDLPSAILPLTPFGHPITYIYATESRLYSDDVSKCGRESTRMQTGRADQRPILAETTDYR